MSKVWVISIVSIYTIVFVTVVYAEYNISTEAREYFLQGKRNMRKGITSFTSGCQILDNAFEKNKVSFVTLRRYFEEEFGDIRIPLTDFFYLLYKRYKYNEFMTAKSLIKQQAGEYLLKAKHAFHEASKCQRDFVEAYLYETLVCLYMGWYEEAVRVFKQLLHIGLDKLRVIDPLNKDIEDVFYRIAMIPVEHPEVLDVQDVEKLSAENIIGMLITYRHSYIDKLMEDAFEDEEINNLMTQSIKNRFELVKFYIKYGRKQEAENVFRATYEAVKEELAYMGEAGNDALLYIESLEKDINRLRGYASVIFKIHDDIIKGFEPVVNLRLVKESEDIAKCDDMYIYIFPEGSGVEFKNQWLYNGIVRDVKVEVPPGEYTLQLDMSNIRVITADKMPCALVLENQRMGWINDKSVKLQPDVFLELKAKTRRECVIQLECNRYIYDIEGGYVIDQSTGQRLKLAQGSIIKRMVMPRLAFWAEEQRGEYTCILDRIGDWTPTTRKDINMAKSGMGIMAFLFLMMR